MPSVSDLNSWSTSEVEKNSIRQCHSLLSFINDDETAEIRLAESGVWNNIVWEVVTPLGNYYYKQYRKFTGLQNYIPPRISAQQRLCVARDIQKIACDTFVDTHRFVPAVLASNNTSFIMEAVPQSKHLLAYLSTGYCPNSVVSALPAALARFHSATQGKDYTSTPVADNRFRDYKISLQYDRVANLIGGREEITLKAFAESYKQQRLCIVHGDLNSKNVLIASDELAYVIDFEQAHWGSPSYDLAFILSELYIASLQFDDIRIFNGICSQFVKRYLQELKGFDTEAITKEATIHLAAQIIYRFTGPSHRVWTSYTSDMVREKAISEAKRMLVSAPLPIDEAIR